MLPNGYIILFGMLPYGGVRGLDIREKHYFSNNNLTVAYCINLSNVFCVKHMMSVLLFCVKKENLCLDNATIWWHT